MTLRYRYFGVGADVAQSPQTAPSQDRFFNRHGCDLFASE
jgi:hypothetical protein